MTMPPIPPGLLHDARTTVSTQEGLRSQRDRIAENSARQAWFTTTHVVSGEGSLALTVPIMFDVTFVHLPCFTSGVYVSKLPDTRHWDYPQASAGVYKWVTEPMPVAKTRQKRADDNLAAAVAAGGPGVIGVAEFSAVKSAAKEPHDPSELLYTGAYLYFAVQVPRRTDDTEDIGVRTPDCSFVFHLSWMGVGLKAPEDVQKPLTADPSADPLPVGTGDTGTGGN